MSEKRWLGAITLVLLAVTVACGGSSEPAGGETSGGTTEPATPPPVSAPVDATGATGTSSITGSVRYEGAIPNLPPLRMDADPGCAKKHDTAVMPDVLVLGEDNALANVMVYVTSGHGGGSYAPPAEAAVLDQQGCKYTPHVISVQAGQAFKILNSDGLLHNVHGLPKLNTPFNRAMPAAVTEADYVFDKEEVFKIKCDVHPWMGAWITVTDHPFFAVSGGDGTFRISGLPAGEYTLTARHDGLGTVTRTVALEDGGEASVDLTMSRE